VAQIGHVHAGLLAGYIDHGRKHRWQAGTEPVRRLLLKSQYRWGQPDLAAAQIDLNPLVLDAAGVDFTGLRDTFSGMSDTLSGRARRQEIVTVVAIVE
jgi:hypothetical protein